MTAGELVRNGSFEAAIVISDWATTAGSPWQMGLTGFTNYHAGTKYAFTGDAAGNTIQNANGSLYQQVTIPLTAVNPTLTFWTKTTTAETTTVSANDTLTVSIMDATGTTSLQSLVTVSNLNAVSSAGPHTATGKYTFHSYALSPSLIGQTVRINFAATTNATLGTTFRVDDVSLAEPVPVTPGTSGQVVGYLPSYRQDLFAQMDLDLVTYINYFSISATTAGAINAPTATFEGYLATVVSAAHAKGVGVSITVGPASFATLAASDTSRKNFALNIKNFLVARNLDGVDIDWEPPATGVAQDNYGLLIDALYAQLHPIGKKITAAVNPWTKEIPVNATKLMDWLNVMCYDFDYANNSTYAAATDGMLQWTYYGVAKDKLVMGDPFYGRSGTSWSNTKSKTYNAFLTEYATLNGVMPTSDVDSYLDAALTRWYVNGINTVGAKAAFVRDNGYGGTMIWELGQDHWSGTNYDRYSLLPIVGTVAHPPAWLTPTTGSSFALVKDQNQFLMHAGTATVSSAMSTGNPNLGVVVGPNARMISSASQKLGSLQIENLGDLTVLSGANKHLYASTLSIAAGGKLDLRDNDLVVNNGDFATIQSLVLTGYSATNDASKKGIVSTSSQKNNGVSILALFNNSLVGFTDYPPGSGNSIAAGAIVGKYTLLGDTNFDGLVTMQDYTAVDANMGTSVDPGIAWFYGDTNFDGTIDSTDYTVLNAALGTSLTQFPAALSSHIASLDPARAAQFIMDSTDVL
jgi:hypothetical protein